MLGSSTYSAEVAAHAYRTWVRDGRLVGFPRKRSRRLPLLDLVAQDFEPGRAYSRVEAERILRRWHPDTATLRRFLVDEGFLTAAPTAPAGGAAAARSTSTSAPERANRSRT